MKLTCTRLMLVIGLGAVAGAVFPARAQVPVSRDTIRVPTPARADSMIRNDSIRRGAVPLPTPPRRDSVKPPLTRAEAPSILEIGPARIYDRAALFATGALTLSDLLGRVPGLTELTTGWRGATSACSAASAYCRLC